MPKYYTVSLTHDEIMRLPTKTRLRISQSMCDLLSKTKHSADTLLVLNPVNERNGLPYKQWRREVFARDNDTCVECESGYNLQAHHIKGYASHPESRFDVDNGQTLCVDCHIKKHPEIKILSNGFFKHVRNGQG